MTQNACGGANDSSNAKDKEFTCDACGSVHDTQTGLSIHESKVHGGPVDGEGKDCPGCERSYSCQRGLIEHLSGKNSCGAGYECDECGRTHPTQRGLSHHKKETHGIETRPEISCTICGEKRRVDPNYLKKADKHFCSNKCWTEWAQENRSGEDNPMWKGGGVLYYGTKWEEKREMALERDDYTCQGCGCNENLHVHHIRPLRTFEDDENPHRLNNLVTLCRSCHKQWEGLPVKPQLV